MMSRIRDLRVTTLAENFVIKPGCKCLGQRGLSFFLELVDAQGDNRKVIFDTGVHKESLLYNIKTLKVDLSDVDCIVLSHGHSDHTATTAELVEATGGVMVYAHPHTFSPRFIEDKKGKRRHGVPRDEGIYEIEKAGGEVILKSEPTEIVPGLWTTGQIRRLTPFERVLSPSKGEKRIIVIQEREINDQILDDQAIWMDVMGVGPCVITGCAHAGPINTLLQVQRIGGFQKVFGIIGGLHLIERSEDYLQQTTKWLKKFGLSMISPCHCTGFNAMTSLWQAFPKAFLLNFSGRVIEIKKEPKRRVI